MSRLCFAAAAQAAALLWCASAGAETVLRYTEPSVNRGERAAALNWFADQVAKRTDGALKINFFWGGALMDARSSLKGVGDRAAEMGSIVGSYTAREMLPYNIGDLPVGSSDVWVGLRAMYEIATTQPDVKKAFDKANVVYLSNFTTTEVQLICKNKVIAKVEDLKGVKIRSAGFYGQVLESLGATVLRFSGVDANRALDNGTIACNHNYLYGMRIFRDYEVAKDIIRLDWGQHLAWAVIVNKEVFAKLPEAQRKALVDAGSAMVDKVAQEMISANENALAAMQAGINGHKVTVHAFPTAEKAKLLKAGEKFIAQWKEKTDAAGYSADRILAAYKAATAKYEAERATKGYPWKR
ncbi:MAG: C4-dicarboxylate TRAP transporter substrate-binding protein [Rhodospirillaceae bacterium]|nr:C4-dicarboxylate TRAP transporter substrate-binding protein [Rhodospirillaceae bacterium]